MVKLEIALMVSFILFTILGKNYFVIAPFVVLDHSCCH